MIWLVEISHDPAAEVARAEFTGPTPAEPETRLAAAEALATLAIRLRLSAHAGRPTARRACA